MSDIRTLDELITRLEKNLERAKAEPRIVLDDPELIKSMAADSEKFDLLIKEVNSRIAILLYDCFLAADSLIKTAGVKDLIDNENVMSLLKSLAHQPKVYKLGDHPSGQIPR